MFKDSYKYISAWIDYEGWIELGQDMSSSSILRILNEGGVIWEDDKSETIDEALAKGEKYLRVDLFEDFGIAMIIED